MKKSFVLFLTMVFSFSFSTFSQTKTITNADLEKYRQERIKNEEDYRQNYAKLGFPSPEELAKQEAERQKSLEEYSKKAKLEKQSKNNDLLYRANLLRSEIADVNAQIVYVQRTLAKLPKRQNVFGFNNFYQQQSLAAYSNYYYNQNHQGYGFNNYFPLIVSGESKERQETVSRLRTLEQHRAGLFSRWNLLAEEARIAGIRID